MNAVWLVLALAACGRRPVTPEAAAAPVAQEAPPPPAPAVEPAPVAEPAPPPPVACLSAADCAANEVCEGEGCTDDAPGHCVGPGVRACTRDLRQWCGCDGVTFPSSGTCPNRRYAHAGPCP